MKFYKILLVLCAHYFIAQPLTAAPFAYVTNYNDDAGTTVTPIDTATNTAGAAITVGTGPQGVAITPDGMFAYVANFTTHSISVINTLTNEVVATIPLTGQSDTAYVAITPNGEFAYVTNAGSGMVSVINTAMNAIVDTITIAGTPSVQGIAITPDGTKAYVAIQSPVGDVGIAVIDTINNTQSFTISLPGTAPYAVAITPNGTTAYVTDRANSAVIPITIANNTAGTPIPLTALGDPVGIAITPNGLFAYVTDTNNNNVTPITIANNTAGTPIALGTGTLPFGIAITPDGALAYVVESGLNRVAIINILTDTLIATTIGVGVGPHNIAITPVIPPLTFIGVIQRNIFLNVIECILTMTWVPSPTTNVVEYQIFRDGVLFATIPATSPLVFTTGLGCNDAGAGFTIAAIDSNGISSIQIPLVIQPGPTRPLV